MANETGEGKAGATASAAHANTSSSETIDIAGAGRLHRDAFHVADLNQRGHDHLTADVAAWRAGAAARNEYAQAQPPSSAHDTTHIDHNAIGRVDKIVGNVTVMRGGVAVVLHSGDTVFKGDVIQTGGGSSIGIFFADGSAVHLAANTRMALNAYSYDTGAGANAAAFSLIDGTFGFVAGKLAGLGDMKITTPVATMSVHEGAVGWAHELTDSETASISTKLGGVAYSFAVTDRGGDSHGLYDLIADGSVVGSINDPHLISYLDQNGNLVSLPLDSSNVGGDLAQFLQAGNTVPGALGVHGSGGPIDAPSFPNPVGLSPSLTSLSISTGSSFNPGGSVPPTEFIGPSLPQPPSPPAASPSNIFIWNGLGDWDKNPLDWNQGFAPTSAIDTVIIQSGKASYNNGYTIGSLTVSQGATLNITGGSLTATSITNSGAVALNSSGADPSLVIDGAITLSGGGTIEMLGQTALNFIEGAPGTGATLTNADNLITGSGNIGKGDGNLTFINEATVDATPIFHGDSGLLVVNTGHAVGNLGVLEATLTGELLIQDQLINANLVRADGAKSSVVIANNSPTVGGHVPANANVNTGLIEATGGGLVSIENSTIVNSGIDGQGRIVDGLIEVGASSKILLDNATILHGFVSVLGGGEMSTAVGSSNRIDTANGPTHNTTVPSIVNDGKVLVSDDSSLTLASPFDIDNAGTIELASTSGETLLAFNQPFAILSGGGNVILDGRIGVPQERMGAPVGKGAEDIIDGVAGPGFATVSLENRDNTISGAGAIGQGDGALAFRNDALGTVDADLFGQTLLIATGSNTIVNAGLFEASNRGILDIASALDNFGHVIARTGSEVLITADVDNESGGASVADGTFARIDITGTAGHPVAVDNFGDVAARNGGSVSFEFSQITNEAANGADPAGRIIAGQDSRIDVDNSSVDNAGVIVARHGGTIAFDLDAVTNEDAGLIRARGRDSSISFDRSRVTNDGEIAAVRHGQISFTSSAIDNTGLIAAVGGGSQIGFTDDRIDNSGAIVAENRGMVEFDGSRIDNDRHGLIVADGSGSVVGFDGDGVDNAGVIVAEHRGAVEFADSRVDNGRHGTIASVGRGSLVGFDNDLVRNSGRIEAAQRGTVELDRSLVANERHGVINADGNGATIAFERDSIDNWGAISVTLGGLLVVDQSSIANARGAIIVADGRGSEIWVDRDDVDNSGRIEADHRGTVVLDRSLVLNDRHGVVEADGRGSEVRFDHDSVDNSGRIAAERNGEVTFDRSHVDNDGVIDARQGGAVVFDHTHVDNANGLIAAVGCGSTIDLDHAHIAGGELASAWGGLIHTVGGNSDLSDVTIACGSDVTVETGTTLTLDQGTTMNGGLLTIDGTLHVEPSLAILNGVNVVNHGDIVVDPGTATLEVENGAVITGGNLTVGPGGTLDVDGSTLTNVAIFDAGVVNFGAGDTLSPGDVLTFVGSGTVNVQDSAKFDVTLAGLAVGAVIDLRDLVVTSEIWDGSSLLLNGAPAAFAISGGLPAGDTFAYKSDGAGGTDLEVVVTGTATVADGGSLEIALPSNQTVTFAGLTGELNLDDPGDFFGHIVGFSATSPNSDVIDLVGIDFDPPTFTASFSSGVLTVNDGTQSASFSLDYFNNLLNFTSDGHGGTLVGNQPSTIADGGSLEIGKFTIGTVNFGGLTGSLLIDSPTLFSGHIQNFLGGDSVEVGGVNFNSPGFVETYDAVTGKVTLSDGANNASLTFDYFGDLLNFASDGLGGTVITTQSATIAPGGSLEISKLTVGTVNFGGTTGVLKIDDAADFSGHIHNFTATTSTSDSIDIGDVNFTAPGFAETYDATTGKVTVTDGVHSASLTFDYFNNLLNFASDGQSGTEITTQLSTIGSGGSLEISKLTVGTVTFTDSTGLLTIDSGADFNGHILGFNGTAPDAAHSDVIDLVGIDYTSPNFTQSYDANTHTLAVSDGTHTETLIFDYFGGTLKLASDGNHGTFIFDPPAAGGTSATTGVAGNDNFKWISEVNESPGAGIHFDPSPAVFSAGQLPQVLASLMQEHAEQWAEAGHQDGLLVNATAEQLQAHILSAAHLH